MLYCRQVDVHHFEEEDQFDDVGAKCSHQKENKEINRGPEESERDPLAHEQHRHHHLQLHEKEEQTDSSGEASRSAPEKRRSDLMLHLRNGAGKPKTQAVLPTSCTSPSLSMIASLISLEAYRSSQEQQQQPIGVFGANMPAQVIYQQLLLELFKEWILRMIGF